MRKHVVLWTGRSLRERADWTRVADARAAEKNNELAAELQSLAKERSLLAERLEAGASQGGPLTMSSAALGQLDIERFRMLMTSSEFVKPSRIGRLRQDAATAKLPLSICRQKELAAFQVYCRQEPQMPEWAQHMAVFREHLGNAAVQILDDAGEAHTWKVLYIVQKPEAYVALCRMTPVETYEEEPLADMSLWAASHSHQRVWKMNFGIFESAADVPERPVAEVWVIPDAHYLADATVGSRMPATPLRLFLECYPRPVPAEPVATQAKKDKSYEDALATLPWLQHLEKREWMTDEYDPRVVASPATSSWTPGVGGDPSAKENDEQVEEEILFEAVHLVEKAKAALASEDGAHREDFGTIFRKVDAGKTSETFDAAQAVARNDLAKAFCRRRGVHHTFRASYSVGHTPADVGVLIRAWTHKMQWYFNLELDHPRGAGLEFGPAMHEAYCEPTDFTALANAGPPKRLLDRIREVRQLFH